MIIRFVRSKKIHLRVFFFLAEVEHWSWTGQFSQGSWELLMCVWVNIHFAMLWRMDFVSQKQLDLPTLALQKNDMKLFIPSIGSSRGTIFQPIWVIMADSQSSNIWLYFMINHSSLLAIYGWQRITLRYSLWCTIYLPLHFIIRHFDPFPSSLWLPQDHGGGPGQRAWFARPAAGPTLSRRPRVRRGLDGHASWKNKDHPFLYTAMWLKLKTIINHPPNHEK